ncbi:hypothetical protein [Methanobrevibacter arboriphilus]|uniref:hypothetical protein n=1 Tax=Methanobrevibacter arboriphilus TaxID=39441 RepID=UPI000B0E4BEC|nr:hypothetical protein [Methanobrevibacter arboriphilus]
MKKNNNKDKSNNNKNNDFDLKNNFDLKNFDLKEINEIKAPISEISRGIGFGFELEV